MLEKLEKLEKLINKVLLIILGHLALILKKLTPHFIFKFFGKVKSLKDSLISRFRIGLYKTKIYLKNNAKEYLEKIKVLLLKLKSINYKERVHTKLAQIKDFIKDSPFRKLFSFFEIKMRKFGNFISNITPEQLAVTITLSAVIAIGFLGVFGSSQSIIKAENGGRQPASIVKVEKKPDYHMYQRKAALVLNVQIPVKRKNNQSLRNITVDFSVRTSTRFAKQYLEFHSLALKDYFLTGVEELSSSFPLEEEGKKIIKNKLKEELNAFLAKDYVEGVVEEVSIIYMVGY